MLESDKKAGGLVTVSPDVDQVFSDLFLCFLACFCTFFHVLVQNSSVLFGNRDSCSCPVKFFSIFSVLLQT